MMFAPFSTNTERLRIGSLSANAEEVYPIPRSINRQPTSSSFDVVNDWREFNYTYDMTAYSSPDWGSFRLSYGCSDNYGTDFDIWFTIKVSGGTSDGRIIYDSGWVNGAVSNAAFNPFAARYNSITLYFRIRYPDGVGTNPPARNMFTGCFYTISFNEVGTVAPTTTALPPSWTADTTASVQTTVTLPDVSTIATTDISSKYDAYSPINLVWFENTLASFGIITGWLVSDLPWIMLLVCWFLICSIVYWLLK